MAEVDHGGCVVVKSRSDLNSTCHATGTVWFLGVIVNIRAGKCAD